MNIIWIKKFYIFLGAWTLLALGIGAYFFPVNLLPFVILGAVALLSGFKLTELLVSVLTGVRKANPAAIALIFFLKLLWWLALFLISRKITQPMIAPLGLGFAAFLLALLSAALQVFGLPKISAPKNPTDP